MYLNIKHTYLGTSIKKAHFWLMIDVQVKYSENIVCFLIGSYGLL